MTENENVLDSSACLAKSKAENYQNRLLILRPDTLKEEYRCSENQYFFAQSGFGCDPSKLGTKVYGIFLVDGEPTSFRRGDFLGIADENQLPEWAAEKLAKVTNPKNANVIQMGGM